MKKVIKTMQSNQFNSTLNQLGTPQQIAERTLKPNSIARRSKKPQSCGSYIETIQESKNSKDEESNSEKFSRHSSQQKWIKKLNLEIASSSSSQRNFELNPVHIEVINDGEEIKIDHKPSIKKSASHPLRSNKGNK